MLLLDCKQRSTEWDDMRLGIPTASEYHKIVTTKGEPSEQRQKYLYELVGERLTGRPTDRFASYKMKKATEREPTVRVFYELLYDIEVQEIGFIYGEGLRYGYSPDGLIGENGLIELKDAEPHVQAMRLDKGWKGREHFQQIQGGLFCSKREWCDLVSFCEAMKPIIIRYERDEAFIAKLEAELVAFCDRLEEITEKLRAL